MITDSSDAAKDRAVTYTYDINDRLLTETRDAVSGDDTYTAYAWGTLGSATQQTGKTIHEGLKKIESPPK